jgi:hypothetical protein
MVLLVVTLAQYERIHAANPLRCSVSFVPSARRHDPSTRQFFYKKKRELRC